MRFIGVSLIILTLSAGALAAKPAVVHPYELDRDFAPVNDIDQHVLQALQANKIRPAHRCSDEVFLRRVYLDMLGILPTPREVNTFLWDKNPDKRAVLIDAVLKRPEYADYWSMKWCDLLRVKAEFPINLWPNAVQAYHRWIYEAMRENMPYDEFAKELLTASGSNFRVPQVNFYRAIQGQEPSAIAGAVALTFMGSRLDTWPEKEQQHFEAFFSRVAYKKTAEWKEEIVFLSPEATTPLDVVFPDGVAMQIPAAKDPREILATWLTMPENPWFARAIVNRQWAWLMGRGIIHEPDDMHAGNPPSNPALLQYLEKELIASQYDLKQIFRLILNSRTYQQSAIPQSKGPEAEALFASYGLRPLEAEVLIDALNWITGSGEGYSSAIPEPFTYIPRYKRTVALADGSITSQFLEMFGRPSRDTGLVSERSTGTTDEQRLYLLNSSHVQDKIQKSWRVNSLMKSSKGKKPKIIQSLYITILSRYPTDAEITIAKAYFDTEGMKTRDGIVDLCWALINSKEFLYHH